MLTYLLVLVSIPRDAITKTQRAHLLIVVTAIPSVGLSIHTCLSGTLVQYGNKKVSYRKQIALQHSCQKILAMAGSLFF